MEVCLTLPYPPSVNHYKKLGRLARTKTGKIYQPRVDTQQTKNFYWHVGMIVGQEGVKSFGGAMIEMRVWVYPPDKRKRDLDGILKVLLDSLERAQVYDDDYQVQRLMVIRCPAVKNGQVLVKIRAVLDE